MIHFHWYCPICKRALGIDGSDPRYRLAWQGPDFHYVHQFHGFEHPLEIVDATQEMPEHGKLLVYVNGREELCGWRPFLVN